MVLAWCAQDEDLECFGYFQTEIVGIRYYNGRVTFGRVGAAAQGEYIMGCSIRTACCLTADLYRRAYLQTWS